jgi:hypothetical protein
VKRWFIALYLAVAVLAIGVGMALLVAFSGDIVTSRYPNLEAARTDQLFERGWLPDILPSTTQEIETTNNLDLSTSEGRFSLKTNEWHALQSRLTSGAQQAPFEDWSATLSKMKAKGFSVWHYADPNTTWVFFCKAEITYCEYTMWMPS